MQPYDEKRLLKRSPLSTTGYPSTRGIPRLCATLVLTSNTTRAVSKKERKNPLLPPPRKLCLRTEFIRHLAPENLILETDLLLDHNLFLSRFYCKKPIEEEQFSKERTPGSIFKTLSVYSEFYRIKYSSGTPL